ncbi:hypothetical protein JRO89_XS02G0254000 [Xanthoceras sorbifolium]|uniref:Protein kinase domain-containing protein n=1 Tax=Xanthoceras sorbifolium TaxID=99658 RepID=A0ABQ8IID1_9ROSI|nr:hypothetical protein JRO89_XS02G0254000 [Xanthoceras sorbifolium]
MKRRKKIKLKEKFFKQNGGLLLQKQLTSVDSSVDRSKLFNSKELHKATDHFNVNRILGQGGQASLPIYLRDIKSSNILLDDKYIVKVADFRTSRSITIDHTHVTTRVQRTFGYFDPEYFRSSQFTDKSDVYMFGVVLVELLNGQKPIFSTVTEEGRSLTSYFIKAMEENNLYDILDAQVKMGKEEEITAVADLTTRCLNLHGQRPTMKEVAMDFDGIPAPEKGNNVQLNV